MGAALFLGSHWHCPHTHDLYASRRKMRTVLGWNKMQEVWNSGVRIHSTDVGGGWATRCCLRWLPRACTPRTEVKLKICTFFPNDPIKLPILLTESGRKIESQRGSSAVGIWLPMKVLSQIARMVSSWQLTDMWGSRIPSDLSSELPVGYSVTLPSPSRLSPV